MTTPVDLLPAAFLDRDGTILDELGYLGDPNGVRLLPGAAAATARLNRAGVPVILVTNQSGVARGLFTERELRLVHDRLERELETEGAHLDAILYCPHHPEHGEPPYRRDCDCRKPGPGLVLEAAAARGLDLARSCMVGDAARDLEAGRRAGLCGLYLVGTGKGSATWDALDGAEREDVDYVADLSEAVTHFLAGRGA